MDRHGVHGSSDLSGDLTALGVAEGDGIFVHSSLGAIGHVIGGPRGLIEALINTVGERGLIGMPGFSGDAYDPVEALGLTVDPADRDRIKAQVLGYDPMTSSVGGNGKVAEAFRGWPGVVRSAHPTSSVLLWGKDAQDFAAPHDPSGWATGPESPWGRLRQRTNMKILLIGVGWNRCSALHAAESVASHRRMKIRHFKSSPNGSWMDAPDVADDLGRLFPSVGAAWEQTGAVTSGVIGGAESRLTEYDALVAFAADWLGKRNASDGIPQAI